MAGKLIVKFLPIGLVMYKVTVYINGQQQEEEVGRGEEKEYIIENDCSVYGKFGKIGGLKSNSVSVSADKVTELTFSFKAGILRNKFEISNVKESSISRYEAKITNAEKTVFSFDSGVGDELSVYEDRIIIKHKGVLNFMAMGVNGEKTIYYSDLTAIQYKAGGMLAGHIQFSLHGGIESTGGVLNAASDENTITFSADKNDEAQKIYEYINNKLREIKTAKTSPIVQAAAFSSADELKKFKELLDIGVISQEEFDAKKKQLLGL